MGYKMGRTAPTYHQALEERLASRWMQFRRLLKGEDERQALDQVCEATRKYVTAATFVGSPDIVDTMLLSVVVELARRVSALEAALAAGAVPT